jgi:GH43 family beta-xylosidase
MIEYHNKGKNMILKNAKRVLSLLLLLQLFNLPISCKEEDKNSVNKPAPVAQFLNPLLSNGPDPWVIKKNDIYYVTHTTGNGLKLYAASNMANLPTAINKTVWTAPASGMNSRDIWAPEIHYINNAWYCYYAGDDGDNANHRMWVLENKSDDPLSGVWVDKGKLKLGDDKWAIDGTVFSQGDQLYIIWSGWENEPYKSQELYISRLSNPWTAEGERVQLSKPELPWERNGGDINEGPEILIRGDKIFLVYSASACWTDDYTLGILSADVDSDLMNPASWTKYSQPVFTKNPEGQVFGPGHCSFFTDADGADWILYHANPQTGQGCGGDRSVRMQPFTWKSDGMPDFGRPASLNIKLNRPS